MKRFKGKIAVITGGASGIGKALGERLSSLGASVVLSDLNEEALGKVIREITASGGKASGEALDVTDYEAFKKHLDGVVATHGRIDYLFNNAGIAIAAEFRDMELKHWQKVMAVNLNGVFHGSSLAYKLMVKQGSGHIINLSSIEGMMPFPGNAAYVASKYAVLGLSQTMHVEGHSLGVKISAVCPGFVKTPIFDVSELINIDREKALDQYALFLNKLSITPEKCARVILKGVVKNKPIIPVTGLAHVIWYLARLTPVGVMKAVRKDFDKWRNTIRLAN